MSGRPTVDEELPTPTRRRPLELSDAEVEERFRRARRSGEPEWLWPDVHADAWRAALSRVEGVLRAELAGGALPALAPLSPTESRALGVAAFTSGTAALLGRWLQEGRLEADPALRELLVLHLEHGRRRWERLSATARQAAGVLADVGLSPIVLKGVHTAPAFFPEPGCRPSSDVDLAVAAGAWPRALAALEEAGYAIAKRQTSLGRVELLPPGEPRSLRSLDLLHADAPIQVDVHAGLDRNLLGVGRLELGEPRRGETAPWPSVHPAARVLAEPLLVATLAAHASEGLHNLILIRAYELAIVIRTETARAALDWDALLARAGRSSFRFLFASLEMAERLAPGTVPASVRDALRAHSPPALRRIVSALTPADTQRFSGIPLEERLMWAGSAGELCGQLAYMAWPPSAGGSWSRVARIYADRLWRVARGRVSLSR